MKLQKNIINHYASHSKDYEKAFDSIEHGAVFNALREQTISENYIDLLQNIYENSKAKIRLHKNTGEIKIEKGVRQGDTISPKLFTASLESIFRKTDWEEMGINVDGEYLTNLRFADDITITTPRCDQLQKMLSDINKESKKVGLKMNKAKTKILLNSKASVEPITIDNEQLEKVNEYIYLGQLITPGNGNEPEIRRRMKIGWKAFAKYKDILNSKIPMCLKRKVYDSCILPSMTYGCETWKINTRTEKILRIAQRAMERSMLKITIRDRKSSLWIRKQTKIKDIIKYIKQQKRRWAGHIARRKDNRWSKRIMEWCPLDCKRSRKKPGPYGGTT